MFRFCRILFFEIFTVIILKKKHLEILLVLRQWIRNSEILIINKKKVFYIDVKIFIPKYL